MGKKVKGEKQLVVSEQEHMAAAARVYMSYSDYVDETTANWSQLGLAMDAALSVKFGSEEFKDEADVVIEGAAFSFLKDIESLRSFFMSVAGVEEADEEKYNFVPVAVEADAPF